MKRLAILSLLTALGSSGCTTVYLALYPPPAMPLCEQVIPPSSALGGDFVRRVRVHVEGDHVSEGFEVIAQHRRGRLTLIGLTRYGAKAFTIVQRGEEIQIVSFLGPIESVPPANILADLYRWPFGVATGPPSAFEVDVRDDGRAAIITHHLCDYRATIVDVTDDAGS